MLKIFLTFFKIGFFTFGGGLGMIPIMEKEFVDNNGWVSKEKFIDAISITQTVPGAIAINLSIFFGYNISGLTGAIIATIGVALPSFLVILFIAIGFSSFNEYVVIQNVLSGIRPAVVGLIIYAAIDLARYVKWTSSLIITISVVVISGIVLNINPIYLILLAIIVGFLVFKRKNYVEKKEAVFEESQISQEGALK